jgi:cysteine desulfurase
VIQDIARVAALRRCSGALLHVDAVQAAGKLELDFPALDADLMSLSSHKIYGPKGVGALIVRTGVELAPIQHGGAQERGLRGGTENVAGIVGFGAAAELARTELEPRIAHTRALQAELSQRLAALPGVTVFGAMAERLSNTLQFACRGWEGEALLMALDRQGFAVSSGSACASGRGEPSHVLLAMGYAAEIAKGAVRVSFGKENRVEEVARFASELARLSP